MKDNNQYEVVLVIRIDDPADFAGVFSEARKRIKKAFDVDKIEQNGGEESGAESFCVGWFDFSIRNREMIKDPPEYTKFPIRTNVDTE